MAGSRLIRAATLAIILLGVCLAPCRAADNTQKLLHVRSTERRMLDLLHDGYTRSATFRRLVDQLDTSDIIVYVEAASSMPPSVDAYMRFAGATDKHRYLRIVLKVKASPDTLIALLGHELQHVNEVALSPAVRDLATFAAMYRHIGDENCEGWDTPAARSVGFLVRDELRQGVAAAPTPAVVLASGQGERRK